MKRFFLILLSAILLLTVENSASAQLSRLHFGDHKINRIALKSLRAVTGEAQVVCTNDTLAFTMSNICGTVYKQGRAFVRGTAEPVTVARGEGLVVVDGEASLCQGITFWDVLGCIAFKASDYTIDVSMTIVYENGKFRHFAKQGMSVAALLGNIRGR